MPEGDTLARTAAGLRPHLVGRTVTAAHARTPGPQVERIVGRRVDAVEAVGKNLLVRFEGGLEIRTHLRMHGSWHRYRPGEPWRRPAARARLVLEVPGAVAVCFDCPTVELFETRAEALHPVLARLGPDLLAPGFEDGGAAEALRRLREPSRAALTIAEALLDQRALAGIGNVVKNETLWIERVDPFATVGSLDDTALRRLLARARRILVANADRRRGPERVTTAGDRRAGGPLYVYDRAGRPCRRCGTAVRTLRHGELPRLTFWCPRCQGHGGRGVMAAIDVRCEPAAAGWACQVAVTEGASRTEHRVTVSVGDLAHLAPGATDPIDLVRRSFAFLLAREPKESILRTFDLPVIGRYFPEYEREIRRG